MKSDFTRIYNDARRQQGFTSQAQLDAFFAHYDHVESCAACRALDGHVLLDDGYQPTRGECRAAKSLYLTYLEA